MYAEIPKEQKKLQTNNSAHFTTQAIGHLQYI